MGSGPCILSRGTLGNTTLPSSMACTVTFSVEISDRYWKNSVSVEGGSTLFRYSISERNMQSKNYSLIPSGFFLYPDSNPDHSQTCLWCVF